MHEKNNQSDEKKQPSPKRWWRWILIALIMVVLTILFLLRSCSPGILSEILDDGGTPLMDWLFPDEDEETPTPWVDVESQDEEISGAVVDEHNGPESGPVYGNEDGVTQLETVPPDSPSPWTEPDISDSIRNDGDSSTGRPGNGGNDGSSGSDDGTSSSSSSSAPDGSSSNSNPEETGYALVPGTITEVSPQAGTEISIPIVITAFPSVSMRCRAIEIVIPLDESFEVLGVTSSTDISGADMGWHLSDNVLRIAYISSTTSSMQYAMKNTNVTLAILHLRIRNSLAHGDRVSILCNRLLGRNSDGACLEYKIDKPVAEIFFAN